MLMQYAGDATFLACILLRNMIPDVSESLNRDVRSAGGVIYGV